MLLAFGTATLGVTEVADLGTEADGVVFGVDNLGVTPVVVFGTETLGETGAVVGIDTLGVIVTGTVAFGAIFVVGSGTCGIIVLDGGFSVFCSTVVDPPLDDGIAVFVSNDFCSVDGAVLAPLVEVAEPG